MREEGEKKREWRGNEGVREGGKQKEDKSTAGEKYNIYLHMTTVCLEDDLIRT